MALNLRSTLGTENPTFLAIARGAAITSALLLGVLSWVAARTYTQIDRLVEKVDLMITTVATEQILLTEHGRRLDRLELENVHQFDQIQMLDRSVTDNSVRLEGIERAIHPDRASDWGNAARPYRPRPPN